MLEDKEPAVQPQQTRGEELVGLSFNPSGSSLVDQAKRLSADLIDLVLDDHDTKENPTWSRNVLKTAAVNALITAQMATVKVLTWYK